MRARATVARIGSTGLGARGPCENPILLPAARARCARPFEAPLQTQRPTPSCHWCSVAEACPAALLRVRPHRQSTYVHTSPSTADRSYDQQVEALLAALNRPRGLHRTFILPVDVGLQPTRASTEKLLPHQSECEVDHRGPKGAEHEHMKLQCRV